MTEFSHLILLLSPFVFLFFIYSAGLIKPYRRIFIEDLVEMDSEEFLKLLQQSSRLKIVNVQGDKICGWPLKRDLPFLLKMAYKHDLKCGAFFQVDAEGSASYFTKAYLSTFRSTDLPSLFQKSRTSIVALQLIEAIQKGTFAITPACRMPPNAEALIGWAEKEVRNENY